mmetsp:Transcript_21580/g.36867  ORF Transcript_21580/g.36867 Transcript_21580/m.36867 type:complete len:253 (-) Transcript_21580:150-908(-)
MALGRTPGPLWCRVRRRQKPPPRSRQGRPLWHLHPPLRVWGPRSWFTSGRWCLPWARSSACRKSASLGAKPWFTRLLRSVTWLHCGLSRGTCSSASQSRPKPTFPPAGLPARRLRLGTRAPAIRCSRLSRRSAATREKACMPRGRCWPSWPISCSSLRPVRTFLSSFSSRVRWTSPRSPRSCATSVRAERLRRHTLPPLTRYPTSGLLLTIWGSWSPILRAALSWLKPWTPRGCSPRRVERRRSRPRRFRRR